MNVVALDLNLVYAINIVDSAPVKQMSREENVTDVQLVFTVSMQMVVCVSTTVVRKLVLLLV